MTVQIGNRVLLKADYHKDGEILCVNIWPALFLHINKKDYVSITLAFLGWGIGVLVGFRDIPMQKEGYGYEDPLEYDLECDFDDDGSINYRDGMDYVDTWH